MYVSTVLFAKHSSQSITLVALKSCWCSSKVFVHREEVQSSGSSLCKTKMNLFWWHKFEKEQRIRQSQKIINCQNILQNNTVLTLYLLYPCYPTQINYMHICSKNPFLMAITCAYKYKVETHVLLTKNE